MTTKKKVRWIGILLGVSREQIARFFANNPGDISLVAFEVLMKWFKSQPDRNEEKWIELYAALNESIGVGDTSQIDERIKSELDDNFKSAYQHTSETGIDITHAKMHIIFKHMVLGTAEGWGVGVGR